MNNKVVFAGNLNFINLAELFQILGTNAGTGILRISTQYAPNECFVYFLNGNLINASMGTINGIDAIYSLFGWMEGEFEFTVKTVTNKNIIQKSRMEIILDGLRMLDDGLIEKIGPASQKKMSSDSFDHKLSGVPLLKGPLVDYMYVVDEEEFFNGEEIVQEGKHGGWIWVILEGIVEIIKETPKGPLKILRITDGSFIGSIASFLMQSNVRSASVRAAGTVQLGVLDSQRLAREFARISSELRGIVISLNKRLKKVTDCAAETWLKNNDTKKIIRDRKPIIKQGENIGKLFTITQGDAAIVRSTNNGHVPLGILHEGDFFGSIPFLDMGHEPYSASIYASDNLQTSSLDSNRLLKEYKQLSPTFKNLIDNITTCISATTMVACDLNKKNSPKKQG
ncbi:MAG: cyclic nucleotide-binding domain-containing protein [Desulfobacterales bacterium]|nr:cyclic nucleotide-binding domain-containing protein [Desulfobacterales bacterium]